MSEPKKQPDDRGKLETCVSKLARGYEEFVRAIEKSASLSKEDLMKAQVALSNVQLASFKRAELALTVASTANGFSLSHELPQPAQLIYGAPAVGAHMLALDAGRQRPAPGSILPGERVIGQRKKVTIDDDGLLDDTPERNPKAKAAAAANEAEEEAEFLDDED